LVRRVVRFTAHALHRRTFRISRYDFLTTVWHFEQRQASTCFPSRTESLMATKPSRAPSARTFSMSTFAFFLHLGQPTLELMTLAARTVQRSKHALHSSVTVVFPPSIVFGSTSRAPTSIRRASIAAWPIRTFFV
jgi:hypothetical protein